MLRYHEGDWNALHLDLYGEVYFPFQVLTVLSDLGIDYEGGEFVLIEQRPRAQSRAHVIRPARGAFVIFRRASAPRRARTVSPRRAVTRRLDRHRRVAHRAGHHLPRRPEASDLTN